MHFRVIQELIEFHPFGGCNFALTSGDRCAADSAQRHNDIEIGAVVFAVQRMSDVDQAFEARANAGLLEHLSDDGIDEVLT